MLICIWCSRSEGNVTFNNKAHVIPQSLKGTLICPEVCDDCNAYFGKYDSATKSVSVELTIKEILWPAKIILIDSLQEVGKNKNIQKADTSFFKINLNTRSITIKPAFSIQPIGRSNILKIFKRGIYKMFLEQIHTEDGVCHNRTFDFIKRFSRYKLEPELPLFYARKRQFIILTSKELIKHPKLLIPNANEKTTLFRNDKFIEFEILGHVFGICLTENFKPFVSDYLKQSTEIKRGLMYDSTIEVTNLFQIDIMLNSLK